jgi:uncharacterized membrane protein SirB2
MVFLNMTRFYLLRSLHIFLVISTYSLFVLRGMWSLTGSAIMQKRWVGIVPHVVDTLLLSVALMLAYTLHQYPFVDTWLTAKVAGLLVYVVLGFIALHPRYPKTLRWSAWLAAQVAFAYIVRVAISHNPIPW